MHLFFSARVLLTNCDLIIHKWIRVVINSILFMDFRNKYQEESNIRYPIVRIIYVLQELLKVDTIIR